MATAENLVAASNLPIVAPTDNEIEAIRKKGAAVVAHNREVSKLAKMIEGMEWGAGSMAVKGASLSPATRYAFAEFCKVVGANPQMHVDILGGKFYLNSSFWFERVNKDERFVDFEQINISQSVEARAHYSVPEWATHAYETVIRKLVPFAPIEKIRTGEITDWRQYVVEVREANWAGGKPKAKKRDGGEYEADPIGNADPAKSSRTRSLRRCAVRAFPAWMQAYEEQIRKAEEAMEAEWEEVKPVRQIASQTGQQLTSGVGEPVASNASDAQQLPVDDRTGSATNGSGSQLTQAERRAGEQEYFGSLRIVGIDPKDKPTRENFQQTNGLPDSVTKFERGDFARAQKIMLEMVTRSALEGARVLGYDELDALCGDFNVPMPADVRSMKELVDAIQAKLDAE